MVWPPLTNTPDNAASAATMSLARTTVPCPRKHLRHQQLVDFRVPVGAPVFHHDEVIVEIGGEAHRCCRPRTMTYSSYAQTADYDAIQQEFRKRSLPSPLDLSPEADVTGSAFFPLLPQPKTLTMKDHTSKGEAELK
jgi:hypothetical protein